MKHCRKNIVDLEKNCKMKTKIPNSIINIDSILENHGLFHLQNFAHLIGDCIFNALQVLLNFRYTSIEIREGTIEYFRACLQKQDKEAIMSYQIEQIVFH